MTELTDRTPVPVEELIGEAVDDGSDYHDGWDGYLSHTFDAEAGVLTVSFKRASGGHPNDPDHGDAEYRFQFLPDTP